MNIAYCIVCHKNNNILRTTINQLNINNNIYLHVDKKSDLNDFKEYENKVNIIKERVNVRWGSYSQIQATLNLLEKTKEKKYDYIFLLSGDCLPLRNNIGIEQIPQENNKKEYVSLDINYNNVENRVKYKYNKYYYIKNKSLVDRIIIKVHSFFKDILFKNKLYKLLPKLYKGTSWFGITEELRDYILDYIENNQWYTSAFKKSYCGDEVFFHTIIYNSKFKENIYKPKDKSNICYQALRYIDWKNGPDYPRTLDESDFEKIINTECLFGRKFNHNLDLDLYKSIFIE